jgi:crossover junction endodeoxyribonuclease RuvC
VRILGIDPGSRFTGYGIIEVHGDRAECVAHGVIRTGKGEFPQRLGTIFSDLRDLIRDHQPDQAAIESVFINRNPGSALKLGQARGAAVCAVIAHGLPVYEYSPRSVKQAVVGRGSADKAQVNHMVSVLLKMPGEIGEDAADALAVALCHRHTQETTDRMQKMLR